MKAKVMFLIAAMIMLASCSKEEGPRPIMDYAKIEAHDTDFSAFLEKGEMVPATRIFSTEDLKKALTENIFIDEFEFPYDATKVGSRLKFKEMVCGNYFGLSLQLADDTKAYVGHFFLFANPIELAIATGQETKRDYLLNSTVITLPAGEYQPLIPEGEITPYFHREEKFEVIALDQERIIIDELTAKPTEYEAKIYDAKTFKKRHVMKLIKGYIPELEYRLK